MLLASRVVAQLLRLYGQHHRISVRVHCARPGSHWVHSVSWMVELAHYPDRGSRSGVWIRFGQKFGKKFLLRCDGYLCISFIHRRRDHLIQ